MKKPQFPAKAVLRANYSNHFNGPLQSYLNLQDVAMRELELSTSRFRKVNDRLETSLRKFESVHGPIILQATE